VRLAVDAIWPHDPPVESANALQALVSRLRRGLGDPELVAPTPGGYRLALADVDATAFVEQARVGRERLHDGDAAGASTSATAGATRCTGLPRPVRRPGRIGSCLDESP
jgi:DNA-binding SARP family transcriptional activator